MGAEYEGVIVLSAQQYILSVPPKPSGHVLPSPGAWRGFQYHGCISLTCFPHHKKSVCGAGLYHKEFEGQLGVFEWNILPLTSKPMQPLPS